MTLTLKIVNQFVCMTHCLIIIHSHIKFGKKWLSSSGDTEWTWSDTQRKYHWDKHSLTFWTFAVTSSIEDTTEIVIISTTLAHSFKFCSCVCFCLYGPFNCILFHKFSWQVSTLSFCFSNLISELTARDFFLANFYPSGPFCCIFSKTSPKFFLC